MSEKNIMEQANKFLAQAEEVFERLGISEKVEEYIKTPEITSIVDKAYDACGQVLQEMTSWAPAEIRSVAEENVKAFQSNKESFVTDFESNFKRSFGFNLITILDWVHDEESVKNFANSELAMSTEESAIQKTAKQVVDQMLMDIAKDYAVCTYGCLKE